MDAARTHAEFGVTSWTLVRAAARCGEWEGLLRAYREPIYGFFRRSLRLSEQDADDATNGFLAREIEHRLVVSHAERAHASRSVSSSAPDHQTRGIFRAYLRRSLRNYATDLGRRKHGRDHERVFVGLAAWDAWETPGDRFDQEWAAAVFWRAMERAEVACRESGLDQHWRLFARRLVEPAIQRIEAPTVEALAREEGLEPAAVSSMIYSAKRRVRREMERVVMESVEDPRDLGPELAEITRVLGELGVAA